MRMAEQVTFAGVGLDRAAQLRGDGGEIARLAAREDAACVVLWRGKPLVKGTNRDALALLPMTHPMLPDEPLGHPEEPIFLGLDTRAGGAPRFARDISFWNPEGADTAALGRMFDPTEQHHPKLPEDHVFADLRQLMARLSARHAELAVTAKGLTEWHATHRFCARCGQASRVAMAGWQRMCPSCGAPHFPRTDPVVIMLVTHGDSVLMGRSPGWPEGMYSLLAGFVEPGETIEAAVRREVLEETGVPVGRVGYLASQPWPFPASLMIGCRAEALATGIRIDPVEIEDAFWVGRSDMLAALAGAHPRIRPARRGSIAHFLLSNWVADRLD